MLPGWVNDRCQAVSMTSTIDICGLTVGLPPRGDALVHAIVMLFTAALGQFGFAVEYVDGVVVGGVLLGGVVADGPTVDRFVAECELQSTDHFGMSWVFAIVLAWTLFLV